MLELAPADVAVHEATLLTSSCMCVQIKQTLIGTGMFSDTVPCHLASGLGAGFFAVCIGSPVDVVKSRMMGMPSVCVSSGLLADWSRLLCLLCHHLLKPRYASAVTFAPYGMLADTSCMQ